MLDTETKRRIDNARDILVGKVPDPKAQVEQITTALIYKFMDDMDKESEELGGKPKFFANSSKKYSWSKLMDAKMGGFDRLNLYSEAIAKMSENPHLPQLFRNIFKDAFLPYRDPETLNLFLKEINGFVYDHSERLGDSFEYLLSVLGSQGDAGQFRTPRHIIDFIVKVVDPKKDETVLDPACGTAGFLISAFKHIQGQNTKTKKGDKLTPDEKKKLMNHFIGYDISPDMVRLSLVNMYLHDFPNPNIHEYDTLTSEDRWEERYDVILANPPFMTPKGGIRPHKRFSVQANRSEVLFVDYIAEHLNNNGRAGVIVPEGIIFQSANAYTALRKMLIESGYLYAVVSLPAGVFNPYSGVKTSILLMDKRIAKMATDILFIKVDNDGFGLGAQRKEIDRNDLTQALEVIQKYQQTLLEGKTYKPSKTDKTLAHLVAKSRLAEGGDHNLSGDRYKETVSYSNQKWPMVGLGDVCDLIGGGTPSKAESSFWNKGTIKWISAKHINTAGIVIGYDLITRNAVANSATKIVPKGSTILVTRVSVGKYAFADDDYAVNQDLTGLVINDSSILDNRYLFYISKTLLPIIERSAQGLGVKGVTKGFLAKLQIPLPPLEVQREIVAEIDGYQKIIDGAKQVVSNYKPSFKIDPSWPMVELGEVCSYSGGTQPPKETFISEPRESYIRLLQIRDYKSDKNAVYIPKSERHKICEPEDVMIGRYGPPVFQILKGKRGAYNVALIKCLPDLARLDRMWLFHFLSSPRIQEAVIKLSGRVRQSGVSPDDLDKLRIPLPSLTTQMAIVAEIEIEQALVTANKTLIEIFERKIKSRIAEVWGEEKKSASGVES